MHKPCVDIIVDIFIVIFLAGIFFLAIHPSLPKETPWWHSMALTIALLAIARTILSINALSDHLTKRP